MRSLFCLLSAILSVGLIVHAQQSGTSELDALSSLAREGHAQSQFNLGARYAEGRGVAQNYAEAVKWWRKAAEQNYAKAQVNLATSYSEGRGVTKDEDEAFRWYRKAALLNNALGQHCLAVCYANGEGVAKDEDLAVTYFRKAAEQNYDPAMVSLALRYLQGKGIAMDIAEAYKWWLLAASHGNAQAKSGLARLQGILTASQIAEGKHRADQHLAKLLLNAKLIEAARKGATSEVNSLLEKDLDVNARGEEGVTALMAAAANSHVEIVRALLAKGANVNAKTEVDGMTALMYAAQGGNTDVVRALLQNGADVKATAANGKTTALDMVGFSSNPTLDKMLREAMLTNQTMTSESRILDPKADVKNSSLKTEIARTNSGATGLALELDSKVVMKFVQIPAGKFLMGSLNPMKYLNKDEKQHEETIGKPFYMGIYPVTVEQFACFVKETGHKTDAEKSADRTWRKPLFPQRNDHPVVHVSWNDAIAFCSWLAKKTGKTVSLPSGAQWEYACRAGTTTDYPWGDDPDGGRGWANCCDQSHMRMFPDPPVKTYWFNWDDGFVFTSPVGSFKPNAFGLYDMIGNVWQWCGASDKTDYPAGVELKRGGSWMSDSHAAGSAKRECAEPSDGSLFDTGFRVAVEN